ncbi:hypothetical protein NTC87_05675, partial [Stenotrophomonas geniculata]|nr:hypothetical protein [Stenotrophomonas geniculata]
QGLHRVGQVRRGQGVGSGQPRSEVPPAHGASKKAPGKVVKKAGKPVKKAAQKAVKKLAKKAVAKKAGKKA